MTQPRLCLHTQTPLVRFLRDGPPSDEGRPLSSFREGEDYAPTPGGVTRMVQALLGRFARERRVRDPAWIALASHGPARVRLDHGLSFEQVRLDEEEKRRYAAAKGALWEAIHGIGPDGPAPAAEAWEEGLAPLSRAMARRTAQLHARDPFDLLYTHDFQLLPLAAHLPRGVPRLFRWHVPVTRLPEEARRLVVRSLDRHDAVIVSTRAYAEALRGMGVRAPVHASYPYLDESRCRVVTREDVDAFERRWGLGPDEPVFVLVARLDPMKSQDVAVRALARLRDAAPRARLLLVGGGGFSAGRHGGLGMPHAARWRAHLEELAAELGVADRVVFTGNVPDAERDVAYTRALAVLLPSVVEGFGLAAVEGWLHGRPVLVSRGAGVSELVQDGVNGYASDPGDADALAERMLRLARDPALAADLGRAGRATARACHLRRGADAVWQVMRGVVEGRASSGTPARG